jgi:hypothetical protein
MTQRSLVLDHEFHRSLDAFTVEFRVERLDGGGDGVAHADFSDSGGIKPRFRARIAYSMHHDRD